MDVAVIVIAICMVVLTLFAMGAMLTGILLGFRINTTLRRVEGLLADVRRETVPILSQSRALVEDAREVGRTLRHQVGRSEYLVENTLRNVADTSARVREAVTGASIVLSTAGRILGLFSGKSKHRVER